MAIRLHRRGIADPGARGLREDRRRIADIPEIDAADVDCLQQRRPELEIDPFDLDTLRSECILQLMTLPYRRKETALLRAYADFLRRRFGVCMRRRCRDRGD